jgi:hypothetical protein
LQLVLHDVALVEDRMIQQVKNQGCEAEKKMKKQKIEICFQTCRSSASHTVLAGLGLAWHGTECPGLAGWTAQGKGKGFISWSEQSHSNSSCFLEQSVC